jgi:hypothetical protein
MKSVSISKRAVGVTALVVFGARNLFREAGRTVAMEVTAATFYLKPPLV